MTPPDGPVVTAILIVWGVVIAAMVLVFYWTIRAVITLVERLHRDLSNAREQAVHQLNALRAPAPTAAAVERMLQESVVSPDEMNRLATAAEVHEANGRNALVKELLTALRATQTTDGGIRECTEHDHPSGVFTVRATLTCSACHAPLDAPTGYTDDQGRILCVPCYGKAASA